MTDTIRKAVAILKAAGISGLGKCQDHVSDSNRNLVDIFVNSEYYCSVNVRSRKVVGI